MTKIIIFALALVLAVAAVYYFQLRGRENPTSVLTIGAKKISVEIAETIPKQILGLSGRESLCADCGMVFAYRNPQTQNFTMKGMNFPLDMIFIRDGRIVEIRANVPFPKSGEEPVVVRSREDADMVLEVNAGFVFKNSLKVGDPAKLR
ncbi:MAG: DUF192 domain-containing protein [Candidatus Doudnabacteria bacterium]|nr:DUF192 domain-containing protein [bacterium]MDZ4244242.1 DUF192 domain-containing protein [Candidatus Doudnabacteria bacterium]